MVGNISRCLRVTVIVDGGSFLGSRVQVNHLATAQIAILLLPLLLRTASKGTAPCLVFVSSVVHYWSPPLKPPTSDQGILDWLNDQSKSEGLERNSFQAYSSVSDVFTSGKPMESRYPVSNS